VHINYTVPRKKSQLLLYITLANSDVTLSSLKSNIIKMLQSY